MPTQTKENYLKAIYFLGQNRKEITLTDLGKAMEVSTPTVNNMVKKLATKGWVNYEKYKPLTLTDLGKKDAALIIRKHRLTEMFLVQIMGFGWEEVHEIAEEMEHLNSEVLFDRMDHILGNPTTDPHGSPIPDKTGNFTRKKYIKLSDVRIDEKAELRAVGDSSAELLLLLNAKNIKLGTEFKVTAIESYDKSMVVNTENSNEFTLSYEVCRRLLVEKT